MAKQLQVTLIRSKYGRKPKQTRTLYALGLHRPGASRVFEDTPAIRGMIQTVDHLVRVTTAESGTS